MEEPITRITAFSRRVIVERSTEVKMKARKGDVPEYRKGMVASVGVAVRGDLMPGAVIVYAAWAGNRFAHDEKKWRSMMDSEILGVIR